MLREVVLVLFQNYPYEVEVEAKIQLIFNLKLVSLQLKNTKLQSN